MDAHGLWQAEYQRTQDAWFERTIDLIRQRFYTLEDFTGQGRAYFSDEFSFDEGAVAKNLKREPRLKELLPTLAERLEALPKFTHDSTEEALRRFSEDAIVKAGLLINAARTALTGQAVGPSMFEIFAILGRERSVERLRRAVALI